MILYFLQTKKFKLWCHTPLSPNFLYQVSNTRTNTLKCINLCIVYLLWRFCHISTGFESCLLRYWFREKTLSLYFLSRNPSKNVACFIYLSIIKMNDDRYFLCIMKSWLLLMQCKYLSFLFYWALVIYEISLKVITHAVTSMWTVLFPGKI